MANKTNVLITVLVLVIVILAGVIIYSFVVKPKISGYTVQKQSEGVQIAVNYILAQLQQNGFVQIQAGEQTIILVPYQPSAAQIPMQTTEQTQPA
ncbi:MAG: hypothetical protein ABH840_01465 [Nanoarchaeota archaeon]